MEISERIDAWIEGPDKDLRLALTGFDDYSQKLITAVDQHWNPSMRMQNMEYFLFLYGAMLAIARGYGRKDDYPIGVLGPYVSFFMDWKDSIEWVFECEAALKKSLRLQGVLAAGGNTAQAVWTAGTQGRSHELSRDNNMRLLLEIFSELRKLMSDSTISDEALFGASEVLYDSVIKTKPA